MSKGVYGVRNPKTVTLTPALVQRLADVQIYELQPIPLRSMVLPRPDGSLGVAGAPDLRGVHVPGPVTRLS